jgi:hypothetical protein
MLGAAFVLTAMVGEAQAAIYNVGCNGGAFYRSWINNPSGTTVLFKRYKQDLPPNTFRSNHRLLRISVDQSASIGLVPTSVDKDGVYNVNSSERRMGRMHTFAIQIANNRTVWTARSGSVIMQGGGNIGYDTNVPPTQYQSSGYKFRFYTDVGYSEAYTNPATVCRTVDIRT